ncbi:hypothetical protein DYB37_000540 [Aphanomyces astaci]|uniref:Uncharacterized protein n=1 Tax=Aphanomyces astaci TaxID=112090 RepID=A0A3R6XW77_APHAT|nr:hypothetical protein DYB35_000163 [Aphanomyces astaci]RHZ27491.1 hypothetical protein DYB37_000540 [Aphanomyces astaci]
MGLRSRKRRLAGIADEDAFDVESSSYKSSSRLSGKTMHPPFLPSSYLSCNRSLAAIPRQCRSVQPHLEGLAYVLVVYELCVLWKTVTNAAAVSTTLVVVLVLMKLLSCAAIYSVKGLVSTDARGHTSCVLLCALHTSMWLLLRAFDVDASSVRNSIPLCTLYYLCATLTVWFIGINAKSEQARAEQLQQLETKFASE